MIYQEQHDKRDLKTGLYRAAHPLMFKVLHNAVTKVTKSNNAELVNRSSSLQRTCDCSGNYRWSTLITKKTLKHDDFRASSGIIRKSFFYDF